MKMNLPVNTSEDVSQLVLALEQGVMSGGLIEDARRVFGVTEGLARDMLHRVHSSMELLVGRYQSKNEELLRAIDKSIRDHLSQSAQRLQSEVQRTISQLKARSRPESLSRDASPVSLKQLLKHFDKMYFAEKGQLEKAVSDITKQVNRGGGGGEGHSSQRVAHAISTLEEQCRQYAEELRVAHTTLSHSALGVLASKAIEEITEAAQELLRGEPNDETELNRSFTALVDDISGKIVAEASEWELSRDDVQSHLTTVIQQRSRAVLDNLMFMNKKMLEMHNRLQVEERERASAREAALREQERVEQEERDNRRAREAALREQERVEQEEREKQKKKVEKRSSSSKRVKEEVMNAPLPPPSFSSSHQESAEIKEDKSDLGQRRRTRELKRPPLNDESSLSGSPRKRSRESPERDNDGPLQMQLEREEDVNDFGGKGEGCYMGDGAMELQDDSRSAELAAQRSRAKNWGQSLIAGAKKNKRSKGESQRASEFPPGDSPAASLGLTAIEAAKLAQREQIAERQRLRVQQLAEETAVAGSSSSRRKSVSAKKK
jgi:hypothetical protein